MRTCAVPTCETVATRRGWCDKHYRRWLNHGSPEVSLNPRVTVGTDLAAKIETYVDRSGGAGACWPWMRGRSTDGYGRIGIPRGGGRSLAAHRVAYEIAHGTTLSSDVEVMHLCDNPPCCNPAHLAIGSHAENMADMSSKQRAAAGERSGLAKFGDETIDEARRLRSLGVTQKDIALRLGISQSYVSRIVRGERRPY